eukprot:UN02021
MDTAVDVASSSKMVSSSLFQGLISAGKLGLDDYVTDYIDFWTKDKNDSRSLIKVKHCMSFTTGYEFGLNGQFSCGRFENFRACIKDQYEKQVHGATPGTVWDYNEFHLQILGAVAENITELGLGLSMNTHLKGIKHDRFFLSK